MSKHKELLLTAKLWMLAGLVAVVVGISMCTEAKAGAYLDVGFSYIDEFGIVERASLTHEDFTISAELSATLEVEQWAGMLRLGYMWRNNIAIEFDSVGTPEVRLKRVNLYYRWEF